MSKWEIATAVEDAGCSLGNAIAALDLLFYSMERECPAASSDDKRIEAVFFSDRFTSVFLRTYSVILRELTSTKKELETLANTIYGEA